MEKSYIWQNIVDKVILPSDPTEKKCYEYAIAYFATEYKDSKFTESDVTSIVAEIIEEANHKLQLDKTRRIWLERS